MTLATNPAEVAARVVAPTATIAAARGAAVLDGTGAVVASDALPSVRKS